MNDIRIEFEPPIVRVILNRPEKHNAVSGAMWTALSSIAADLETRNELRAAILTGAGQEAFSAGADIAEMESNLANPDRMQAMQDATQSGQEAWWNLRLPTIAVIRGACVGGGCGLAIACDLRLATPDAYFAITPAKLGLAYSLPDTRRLTDLVGPARAKEILFTARKFTANEALAMGLINQIVTASDIDDAAAALAHQIAANAPSSLRTAKHLINGIAHGQRLQTPATKALFDNSFRSADFLEGAAAFREKRKPRFK